MNQINFSENIIKFRHQKKITQEQLADFIGVTKAFVSKWENKQSMPDILTVLTNGFQSLTYKAQHREIRN